MRVSIRISSNASESTHIDRRRLLKAGAGFTASVPLIARRRIRAQEGAPLRILGWGHYFNSDVTARFAEATGVRIEVTPIGALDDVVLFLRAGGVGLYDLVSPSSGLLLRMFDEGLIEAIDAATLGHFGDLLEPFAALSHTFAADTRIGIPLLWGSLGAVFPTEAAGSAPERWVDLFEEPFAKSVVMPDDVLGHFWIWNWALGAEDPTRVTRDELEATTEALITMKTKQTTAWDGSVFGAMRRLAGGRGRIASVGWQSAPLLVEPGERALAVSHPEPGDASFCDCIALVTNAPHREAALAFIDYMLEPGTQAHLATAARWATVSRAAVESIDSPVRDLVDYGNLDRALQRSPIRGYPPFRSEGDIATYFDWIVAWDRVRATRVGG
jgi:spermidine/putrescine-binding protein